MEMILILFYLYVFVSNNTNFFNKIFAYAVIWYWKPPNNTNYHSTDCLTLTFVDETVFIVRQKTLASQFFSAKFWKEQHLTIWFGENLRKCSHSIFKQFVFQGTSFELKFVKSTVHTSFMCCSICSYQTWSCQKNIVETFLGEWLWNNKRNRFQFIPTIHFMQLLVTKVVNYLKRFQKENITSRTKNFSCYFPSCLPIYGIKAQTDY